MKIQHDYYDSEGHLERTEWDEVPDDYFDPPVVPTPVTEILANRMTFLGQCITDVAALT